jgi:D-alanyl-D-alanine carboxypeptidase
MRTLSVLAALACLSCAAETPSIPPLLTIPVPELSAAAAPPRQAQASGGDAAHAPDSFDLAAIDAWVAKKVKDQHLVGLSLAIVRDGKIVLAKGYGLSSLEKGTPVETTTAFAVGSITKQFTCASVLLLEEAGKLSLKSKLSTFYPELPRAKEITLGDLGAHVSGYADYYPLDFFDSRMLHAIPPDDLIHQYAKEPLDFEPHTRWSYSNTGFVILGRVVEKVSKKPFGAFVTDRILRPLGMTHASFAPDSAAPGLATGYESFALSEPRVAPREPEAWMYAAGALYASATDLAIWDLALADGKVLRPASFKEMTTPYTLKDGRETGYGCGLRVRDMKGEKVLSHGGEVNGFLAENAVIPRTRSAVVLLSNSQFGDPAGIFDALVGLVVKDGATTAKPPVVAGPSPRDAGLEMLRELQSGTIDRTKLGAEFSLYMTDAKVADAKSRLAPLGAPTSTEIDGPFERGGMEVVRLHFTFASTKLDGLLYRTSDGKVQELLISKP